MCGVCGFCVIVVDEVDDDVVLVVCVGDVVGDCVYVV